jgi:phage regulator Rha-like protein
MNNNLAVIESDGILVVDSRLVADQLGIQHRSFFQKVILKYQQDIEEDWGVVRFQIAKLSQSARGGRPERYALLTEQQAYLVLTYSKNTSQSRQCKRQLVKAFDKAKKVIQETLPAQAQEIEKLKLELELAKTQERLLTTTSALATMHGSGMVALILGKPDAIITKTERVETVVTVDGKGKAISSFDGVGITYLAKRYGFGSNTKACRYWLESIGIREEQWLSEPTLIKSQKLPRDLLPKLDALYAARTGVRQRLLGE